MANPIFNIDSQIKRRDKWLMLLPTMLIVYGCSTILLYNINKAMAEATFMDKALGQTSDESDQESLSKIIDETFGKPTYQVISRAAVQSLRKKKGTLPGSSLDGGTTFASFATTHASCTAKRTSS